MHLAGARSIRQADRGSPMRQNRDQCGGDRECDDEGKEKLHGVPMVFREPNVASRQFSEMESRSDRCGLARLHDVRD